MKPVYTVLLKRGEREHLLSFPLTTRRIEAAEAALGYGPDFDSDNDDGYIVEYRSRIGAAPDTDTLFSDVNRTAMSLSKFTPAQISSLRSLCRAFGLTYWNVDEFFAYLCLAKRTTRDCIAEQGVPGTPEKRTKTEGGNV